MSHSKSHAAQTPAISTGSGRQAGSAHRTCPMIKPSTWPEMARVLDAPQLGFETVKPGADRTHTSTRQICDQSWRVTPVSDRTSRQTEWGGSRSRIRACTAADRVATRDKHQGQRGRKRRPKWAMFSHRSAIRGLDRTQVRRL